MKGMRLVWLLLCITVAGLLLWFGATKIKFSSSVRSDRANPSGTAGPNGLQLTNRSFSWRDVESDNYQQYVDNLRGTGCPEATVEDIVVADVNQLFFQKAQPLLKEVKQSFLQFYSGPRRVGVGKKAMRAEVNAKLEPLNGQRLALIRRLLGHDPERFKTASAPWAYLIEEIAANEFPYLPAEKAAKLVALTKASQEKIDRRVPPGSGVGNADLVFLEEIRKGLEAQIAELLTPAELEQYLLYHSKEAEMLGVKLGNLAITDTEFQQMFSFMRDYYKNGFYTPQPTELQEQKLELDFQAVLGQERHSQYQRENDFSYRKIKSFTQQSSLTEEQAIRLYETRKELQRESYMAGLGLDSQARKEKLLELVNAADARITEILGDDKLRESFLQSPAGSWFTWYRSNPDKPMPQPVRQTQQDLSAGAAIRRNEGMARYSQGRQRSIVARNPSISSGFKSS